MYGNYHTINTAHECVRPPLLMGIYTESDNALLNASGLAK